MAGSSVRVVPRYFDLGPWHFSCRSGQQRSPSHQGAGLAAGARPWGSLASNYVELLALRSRFWRGSPVGLAGFGMVGVARPSVSRSDRARWLRDGWSCALLKEGDVIRAKVRSGRLQRARPSVQSLKRDLLAGRRRAWLRWRRAGWLLDRLRGRRVQLRRALTLLRDSMPG